MAKPPTDQVLDFALPQFTAEELTKIQETAREAVRKEQHDAMFKAALAEATKQARIDAGLVADPAAVPEEELVEVRINLPESITPLGCLTTNQRCYWHGEIYRVPAAVAIDLASRQWMAWVQDSRIKGTWTDRTPKPSAATLDGTGGFSGHMPVFGR